MRKTQLTNAIKLAITGMTILLAPVTDANATVTTMYNLSTSNGDDNSTNVTDPSEGNSWGLAGGTDGWANGAGPSGQAVGSNPLQKWAGTSSATTAAFGYAGAHLNWGFSITGGNGGSGEISAFDAFNRYGVYADIDTAKGAWSATNTGSTFGGWRHDLDVGLFKSDTTGLVTLRATGVLNAVSNFGFTVFKGRDSVTDYNHHGQWNNNSWAVVGNPYVGGVDAGLGLAVSDVVARSIGDNAATPLVNEAANLNTISFNAVAGEYYTIFIGGYRNGTWGDTNDGYRLSISQVPVPGAVWLFGTALAGLGLKSRRQRS